MGAQMENSLYPGYVEEVLFEQTLDRYTSVCEAEN